MENLRKTLSEIRYTLIDKANELESLRTDLKAYARDNEDDHAAIAYHRVNGALNRIDEAIVELSSAQVALGDN